MKRDLDFIRCFLQELEADEWRSEFVHAEVVEVDRTEIDVLPRGWDHKKKYHFELMKDAGFVKEFDHLSAPGREDASNATAVRKFRLTNAGHDYLDAIRDDTVWRRTKDKLTEVGGGAALDVVKAVAVHVATQLLKLGTGQ
ncbi:DUF2513 domain-containing protein [Rhodovulum euryhalinum]|uniref:DUF2513 domain-containing protein n=1 Tax=Rhodovulum euryhalinum TaxID=35805 RepID=UPI001404D4F9|nr:DUF2513 domain-containing protein [Rhodovulum euryhalinum]